MGIGAAFKLNGKDKDKDKERDKGKEGSGEQDSDKTDDDRDNKRRSRHISLRRLSHHPSERLSGEEEDIPASASTSAHDLLASLHHPYGWTAMLEDWFCNGGSPQPPTATQDADTASGNSDDCSLSPKAKSTGELDKRIQPAQKGPYELLIKERLMGIYLAIFIKRECRNLVRGMSKDSVTAGLIGGRVGNKGGVGISINLNGTTLLFLNAHLAGESRPVFPNDAFPHVTQRMRERYNIG